MPTEDTGRTAQETGTKVCADCGATGAKNYSKSIGDHPGWFLCWDCVCRRLATQTPSWMRSVLSAKPENPPMTPETPQDARKEQKVGIIVTCAVCGFQKKPIGRDAPFNAYYCQDECAGYRQPPYPGSLWPGETETDFGYPVGNDGVELRRTDSEGRR